jgi:hypothetical protein
MTDAELDDFVTRHLAAWNDRDSSRRAELVATLCAQHAPLVNGRAEYRGRDAIAGAVTISHDAFVGQGYLFRLGEGSAAHHQGVRLAWTMACGAGAAPGRRENELPAARLARDDCSRLPVPRPVA